MFKKIILQNTGYDINKYDHLKEFEALVDFGVQVAVIYDCIPLCSKDIFEYDHHFYIITSIKPTSQYYGNYRIDFEPYTP